MASPQSISGTQAPYVLSSQDVNALLEIVSASNGTPRENVLRAHVTAHGLDDALAMFGQFVEMALSVTGNCRLQTELVLVTEGGMHPHQAEQINMPTIVGALQGVLLANAVDASGTCSSCAFRLATPANQSPSTTADAEYCSDELKSFFCHKRGVMQNGALTRRCVGDAKIQKRKPHD